jgi:hypothetical protein
MDRSSKKNNKSEINIGLEPVGAYNRKKLVDYYKHIYDEKRENIKIEDYVFLTKNMKPRTRGFVFLKDGEVIYETSKSKIIKELNKILKET